MDEPKKASRKRKADASKDEIRQDIETLHKEMELAQYARGTSGNPVRRVPTSQRSERNRKRKALEEEDDEIMLENIDERPGRLRGARMAQTQTVLDASQVFFGSQQLEPEEEEQDKESLPAKQSQQIVGELSGSDEEGEDDDNEEGEDGDGDEEDADYEEDDGDDEGEEGQSGDEDDNNKQTDPTSAKQVNKPMGKRKRKIFRLKNFRSQRMAQRHGEAMGAHARGLPKMAIFKLKQIAAEAPSAPQIYSSLGLVYDGMLKECQRKYQQAEGTTEPAKETDAEKDKEDDEDDDKDEENDENVYLDGEITPDPALAEQLKLAKKAYGAYHIAALLCKKDFSLWVRAADSACEIVELHTQVMLLSDIPDEVREYHRSEKLRWLAEAKSDYQAADNLRPGEGDRQRGGRERDD